MKKFYKISVILYRQALIMTFTFMYTINTDTSSGHEPCIKEHKLSYDLVSALHGEYILRISVDPTCQLSVLTWIKKKYILFDNIVAELVDS